MTRMHIRTLGLSLLMGIITTAIPLSAANYNISTSVELGDLATNIATHNGYEGDNFLLTADITLPTTWTAIGTKDHPFQGHFDGGGHLIRGLKTVQGDGGQGVFGYIGNNGIVTNLGVVDGEMYVESSRCTGTLAGVCEGTIDGCWTMAHIRSAGSIVGGLVGELKGGTLSNVYSTGIIHHFADTIGALVGYNNGGHLTRAYSTGYTMNGFAFVGKDNNGIYEDCYYDHKLYYVNSGADNDVIHRVDNTSEMFSIFAEEAQWTTLPNRYPQLSTFANTDASKVSVVPIYLNSESTDHADDLLHNFEVDTTEGVTWACQQDKDTLVIQLHDNKATVKRPCSNADIMLDAIIGIEHHTFYLRPRRVDDLQIGEFGGSQQQEYCLNTLQNIPSMPSVKGGTPKYHYRVILDSIDSKTQTEKLYIELANDDDESIPNYSVWKSQDSLPTSIAGHFKLRFFVHDEGCEPFWKESDSTFEYFVKPMPTVSVDTTLNVCMEGDTLTLTYSVTSGRANYFRINYSSSLAKLVGRSDTAGSIITEGIIKLVNIPPLGDDEYTLQIAFGDTTFGESPSDFCFTNEETVRIKASVGGYVHSKFDRILFVDNNPNNGELPAPKLSFKSYQWYRDGVLLEGQTKQYYSEEGMLSGVYYVMMTDNNNITYRSCEVTMTSTGAPAPKRLFPVPANTGELVTIICSNADITLISSGGERILTRNNVEQQTSFNAPPIPGFYFVRIEFQDGRVETEKLIVK